MAIFSTLLFTRKFFLDKLRLFHSSCHHGEVSCGRRCTLPSCNLSCTTYAQPLTLSFPCTHSSLFSQPCLQEYIYISVSLFRVTRRFLLSPPIRSFFLIILAVCCPRSNHDAVPAAAHSMCMFSLNLHSDYRLILLLFFVTILAFLALPQLNHQLTPTRCTLDNSTRAS